jgi:hypothetical protein
MLLKASAGVRVAHSHIKTRSGYEPAMRHWVLLHAWLPWHPKTAQSHAPSTARSAYLGIEVYLAAAPPCPHCLHQPHPQQQTEAPQAVCWLLPLLPLPLLLAALAGPAATVVARPA